MGLIFLGGINGVGKTAIAQGLSKVHPVRTLHGTTELMEMLGIPSGDYEALKKLPEAVKEEAFEGFFRDLGNDCNAVPTIVTAHYVKVLNGEITTSYGPWYGYCDALVLVVSSPEEIVHRINRDEASGQRTKRGLFGTGFPGIQEQMLFLEKAQLLSAKVMARASQMLRVPSFHIKNTDGMMEEAINQLARIIV